MSEKALWKDLLDREKKFRDYDSSLARGGDANNNIGFDIDDIDILFGLTLQEVYLTLKYNIATLDSNYEKPLSDVETLKLIYSRVYDDIAYSEEPFYDFIDPQSLYYEVFDICLFMTLSMFIHTSTRIKASSLRELTYQYSHMGFSNQPSKSSDFSAATTFRDLDKITKDRLYSTEVTLRKHRDRLFSGRTNDIRNHEWSAMPKSSKHEWSSYFDYQETLGPEASFNDEMKDTFKRIGNLYNDINKAVNSEQDSGYKSRLQNAFKKFCSKLKKLGYKNYLNLCCHFVDHIEKDPKYYGMNLYRLEKELRIYEISHEVNLLRQCTDEEDKSRVLLNYMATKNICFPRLRRRLHELQSPVEIQNIAVIFQNFIDRVIKTSRLLLDKFIEDGVLGENWEVLFLDTINKLTENVLFNPKSIDYTSEDTSFQEEFERILKTETEIIINFQPDPSATNIVG